jgi:hypothetical protein
VPQFVARQLADAAGAPPAPHAKDGARKRIASWLLASAGEGGLVGSLAVPLLVPAAGAAAAGCGRLALSRAALAACHPFPVPSKCWAGGDVGADGARGDTAADVAKFLRNQCLAGIPRGTAAEVAWFRTVFARAVEDFADFLERDDEREAAV